MSEVNKSDGASGSSGRLVVVDLGKKKRKDVKRLRDGGGKLMDTVQEQVAALRAEGAVGANHDVVVVVVERKADLPFSNLRF